MAVVSKGGLSNNRMHTCSTTADNEGHHLLYGWPALHTFLHQWSTAWSRHSRAVIRYNWLETANSTGACQNTLCQLPPHKYKTKHLFLILERMGGNTSYLTMMRTDCWAFNWYKVVVVYSVHTFTCTHVCTRHEENRCLLVWTNHTLLYLEGTNDIYIYIFREVHVGLHHENPGILTQWNLANNY